MLGYSDPSVRSVPLSSLPQPELRWVNTRSKGKGPDALSLTPNFGVSPTAGEDSDGELPALEPDSPTARGGNGISGSAAPAAPSTPSPSTNLPDKPDKETAMYDDTDLDISDITWTNDLYLLADTFLKEVDQEGEKALLSPGPPDLSFLAFTAVFAAQDTDQKIPSHGWPVSRSELQEL